FGCLPIDREARLGAYRVPVCEGVREVEHAVHLVRVLAVSANLEPLLHEAVGDEVLPEQRGADVRADLPGVLAELSLRRRGKRERRACTEHEPSAKQRTRRGNSEDGVAEP